MGDFEVGFGDLITPLLAKGGYPGTSQGCQLSNDARGKSSSQLEKILRRKEKKIFSKKISVKNPNFKTNLNELGELPLSKFLHAPSKMSELQHIKKNRKTNFAEVFYMQKHKKRQNFLPIFAKKAKNLGNNRKGGQKKISPE